MRGVRPHWASVGCVAGLCALAIAIAPVVGPRGASVRVAGADPRWDGEWEHRLPEPIDVRFLPQGDSGDSRARIANRWLGEDDSGVRPVLAAAGDDGKQASGGLSRAMTPAPSEDFIKEVPQRPILRIETEQHAAPIRSIDIDRAGRYLVTGSWDKTARIWAIPQADGEDFRLERVLRPPIGDGNEGKIYAVAMSPDGGMIAIGGWTGFEWDQSNCLYIFDRASGQLLHRLTGLPQVAVSIGFSPDGQFLAAGLLGKNGVYAFRTSDWTPVDVEDRPNYGGSVYGLSFAPDGRLATASYDGFVRLYTPKFRLLAKRIALDGDEAYRLAFSSDGRLAVASVRRALIAVLDGESLDELYRPATGDLAEGETSALASVAWSADDATLYTAGRADIALGENAGEKLIRAYANGGRGDFVDMPAGKDTIMGLKSIRDGVIFASQDPEFGLFNDGGRMIARIPPRKTEFRSTPNQKLHSEGALRLSKDGAIVGHPFDTRGEQYWRFDSAARKVETAARELESGSPPRIASRRIKVDRWIDDDAPHANGNALTLNAFEVARSLAIAPRADRFLLGTEFFIRLFDRQGKQVWSQPGPAVAWKVNISGDGRLAVAAYGDGTVRWHDMRDGKELLALFVANEPNDPRWVAWTPSGYYDASPGAEDLIGWHVNQGKDKESLFFSASRFRDLYYRPGIAQEVLKTLKVAAPPSREELLKAAPPIVTILGEEVLPNGDVVLEYEAKTIFGEPVEIEVFADDARLDLSGARYATIPEPQKLTVPRGACASTIALVGKTEDGRRSEAETVAPGARAARLPETCRTGARAKPDLTALVIGVSAYANPKLKLSYAHQDALDFAAALKRQQGRAYNTVTVTTLTDKAATKQAIEGALALLQDEPATANDVTIIFFAGHGVKRLEGGAELFLVSENADMGKLASTAVAHTRLVEAVKNRAGRKFVFLDACFSNFAEATGLGLFDMQGIANILGGSDIRAEVFSSATGTQLSWENADWGNGAFTEALLEALGGSADYPPKDGRVTNDEINLYVKRRVRELVAAKYHAVQTPTYTAAGGVEFPLAELSQ